MKHIRSWAPAALFALLLAACGGGDPDVPGSGSPSGAPTTKGAFSAIVMFGSSESDMGTYAPATSLSGNGQAPYFGGKFTTNDGATGKVWVEKLAESLNIPISPAEVGFAGQSVKCPAAALGAPNSCTNYAQGGARVTNPDGRGHSGGALTVPLVTQIDNHIARFSSFKATDLIFVAGGINDLFNQIEDFALAAAQVPANATADQAKALLLAAQTDAQGKMKQAAVEMAGYIRTKILANGGKYVAVLALPDFSMTPFGQSIPAQGRSVVSALSDTYNLWLRDGLTGQPVQILDSFHEVFNNVVKDPAKYGFADVARPACDKTAITGLTGGRITTGSSLFCNATPGAPYNTLTTGADPATWFFADDVHPTTGGHLYISVEVTKALASYGWI